MIRVIYEDKDFIVLDKPAGLLVHGARLSVKGQRSNMEEETVAGWLLKHYPEVRGVGDGPDRPGIVHRLDKDTSGVLLIARNQKFFEYLKKLFQEHKIQKTYLALVYGRTPKKGCIEKPIGLRSGTVKRSTRARAMKMVKEAVTEYITLESFQKGNSSFSFLRVIPKTGRTHQIRVHLSSIGHPLVGDKLYGPKNNPLGLSRQFLHAESVEFSLESGRRIRIEAEMPEELQMIISKLEARNSKQIQNSNI